MTVLPRGRKESLFLWAAIIAAAAVAFVLLGAPLADEDSTTDLLRSAVSLSQFAGQLRWLLLLPLLVCAVVHYFCAAVALQAAAGFRMPMRNRVLAQLAASTANRLTPAGLGGAAVNARFLVCSGQHPATAAVTSVGAAAVVGAVADLLVFAALLGLSSWTPYGASGNELTLLEHRITRLVTTVALWQVLLAMGLLVLLAIWSVRLRSRSVGRAGASAMAWRRRLSVAVRQLRQLWHRPTDLGLLLAGSAGTTVAMGCGLALAVLAVPGTVPGYRFGALVVAYMLGSALSSAVPAPAGIGVTEAGLVAALSLASVPSYHALQSVLLFRIVTFWAPALVGLVAARTLRSEELL